MIIRFVLFFCCPNSLFHGFENSLFYETIDNKVLYICLLGFNTSLIANNFNTGSKTKWRYEKRDIFTTGQKEVDEWCAGVHLKKG